MQLCKTYPKNISGLEPNTEYSTQMLDSDSAIVSCETILEIKEGVTIRRPLHGYRDRVAVWHLVINSRKSRNFSYYTPT